MRNWLNVESRVRNTGGTFDEFIDCVFVRFNERLWTVKSVVRIYDGFVLLQHELKNFF